MNTLGVIAMRLGRWLSLDLSSIESDPERRDTTSSDSSFLIWTHVVPPASRPTAERLDKLFRALIDTKFEVVRDFDRVVVLPADISNEELHYRSQDAVNERLATTGGGVLLKGHGTGLAFVCDPFGVTHGKVIKRAKLSDEVSFGEYSFWIPFSPNIGNHHLRAAQALETAMPQVEVLLRSVFGFSLGTWELPELGRRWAYHREVSSGETPSELLWYQYFSSAYGGTVMLSSYRLAGCTVEERKHGGMIARFAGRPDEGLERVGTARLNWLHRNSPSNVC